jgi:hypothetical protein
MADDALKSKATSEYFSTPAEILFRILKARETDRLPSWFYLTLSTAFIKAHSYTYLQKGFFWVS